MKNKLLMKVSHLVEAQIMKDILEDAGIPVHFVEHDQPYIMELYFGQGQKGVDLYVDPIHYDEAKKIVEEAEIVD